MKAGSQQKAGKHSSKRATSFGYRFVIFMSRLIFVIGIGILLYPTIANQWNTLRQQQLISSYQETVSSSTDDSLNELWDEAREYNKKHSYSNIYAGQNGDVFDQDGNTVDNSNLDSKYYEVLNPAGDGIMGYISIPKIDINLPIYHGTSEEVLKKGVGHLSGSNLPIGGEGNHCVLAAHRGLPNSKLFTDLNQLAIGDEFYISVLDETFAYEVDQILPMIDPDDMDTMLEATSNVEGMDYVTLCTCTPYSVNTHRLLVRGHRIPYVNSEEDPDDLQDIITLTVENYYSLFLIVGIVITIAGILIIRRISKRRANKRRDNENEQNINNSE